jgi:hypothetical protein
MAWINKKDILPGKMDKKKLTDAGMALVLIMLLVGFFSRNVLFYKLAIPVLLLNMAVPQIYYPFAWIWYTLSNFIAIFISRILLSVIYLVLVVPTGTLRKLTGKDSLSLKKFKKGQESVMKQREYTFTPEDLTRPY